MTGTVPAVDAVRAAGIMLRGVASAADLATLLGDGGATPALIKRAEALPAFAALPIRDQVVRAYNATLGRIDGAEPVDTDHFLRLVALGDYAVGTAADNQASLVDLFDAIRRSGYRNDRCAAPVAADAPMCAARDGAGNPLLFTVGMNRHCYLFRKKDGVWGQLDLGAQLSAPSNGHVQALDVQQDAAGALTIVLAVCARRGDASSTVYLAAGVSNTLDDAGWQAVFRTMEARPGLPAGSIVGKLSAVLSDGGRTLVLAGVTVQGVTNTYTFDPAGASAAWSLLRIPEDADAVLAYAVGRYRYPGIWTLYRVSSGTSLIFTSFPDRYGKTINLDYTQLPAGCTGFRLGQGGAVPDLYVAGDGIAVYRAGHANPEVILAPGTAPGATLVWTSNSNGAEHVAFISADHRLMAVSRGPDGWGSPYAVADGLAAAALLGSPGHGRLDVLGLGADGVLVWRGLVGGQVTHAEEIAQRAVWEETPLSKDELMTAISAAAPLFWLASDEHYYPSKVEFFLQSVGLWSEITQAWVLLPGTLYSAAEGDMVAEALDIRPRTALSDKKHDSDYVLKIPDAAYDALLPGHPEDAPWYVHAKFNPIANATDLVFWAFYPYNGPGLLKLDTPGLNRRVDLKTLGAHEGDWEHVLLRIDNDTGLATKTFLSQHDAGAWCDVSTLERDAGTGRPVFYISRHGHACYTGAGDNMSLEKKAGLYDIGLINHCDQGQAVHAWENGRTHLISAPWLGADAPAEPRWLQFPWRWGRYFDFTVDQVKQTIDNVLGPSLPGFVTAEIASELVEHGMLGSEGNSAGPQAVKYKPSWFGGEED